MTDLPAGEKSNSHLKTLLIIKHLLKHYRGFVMEPTKTTGPGDSKTAQSTRERLSARRSGFAEAALLVAGIALSSCHTSNISQPSRSVDSADATAITPRADPPDAAPASSESGKLCEDADLVATRNDSSETVKKRVCFEGTDCAVLEERLSTTTAGVGSRLPFAFGAVRITGIDGAGVDLAFEGHDAPDPLRLNYGRQWRLGEFVLVHTIRAEPGPGPSAARIIMCQPIFPDQRHSGR